MQALSPKQNIHRKSSLSPCRLEALYRRTVNPKLNSKLNPKPQNPTTTPQGEEGPHTPHHRGGGAPPHVRTIGLWAGGGRGARDHIYIYTHTHIYMHENVRKNPSALRKVMMAMSASGRSRTQRSRSAGFPFQRWFVGARGHFGTCRNRKRVTTAICGRSGARIGWFSLLRTSTSAIKK